MRSIMLVIAILSASFGFAQETCAEKAKRDSAVFKHRAPLVYAATKKIVKAVPFSKRETDEMPLDQVQDLAVSGYLFGFVASLKPKENLKADFLRRTQKSVTEITRDLPPSDSAFVSAWASKIINIMSKSFDIGYEDGSKPCPQY